MPDVFESGANILLQYLWHICVGVPPRGGQGGNCPQKRRAQRIGGDYISGRMIGRFRGWMNVPGID